MNSIIEISKEEYENFLKQHPEQSHFLKSSAWAEFSKKKKNLSPYYIGLIDKDKNIIATSLLLKKQLPLHFCYFYIPRGYTIDYHDKNLVKTMTEKIIDFAKKHKAIFVKMDPDIIIKEYNYLEEEQSLDYNPAEIFQSLKKIGFKHLGFTKNFETMQPRYTFRIDLEQPLEEIENHFSKTTKQRITKSIKLDTEVTIGCKQDIKEFYHLMTLTETRKDFVSYNEDYYENLYEIFNKEKQSKATLFLGKINFSKTLKALENNLENIKIEIDSIEDKDNLSKSAKNKLRELNNQKENITKDIEKYKNYQQEYGDCLTLSAHMIIQYGNKAWVLYAGNHNILSETYVNYNTYYNHIKYCKEQNVKIYDQFGTIGDLSKDNPRLGLHEFKKKFGGNYIEFLGEWDLVLNKFMYFVFTKLVPIYRNFIKSKSKKEIQNEVGKINKRTI